MTSVRFELLFSSTSSPSCSSRPFVQTHIHTTTLIDWLQHRGFNLIEMGKRFVQHFPIWRMH